MITRRTSNFSGKKNLLIKLIKKQKGRCIYCNIQFGDIISIKNGYRISKAILDHFIPFSFTQNNRKDNFVVSCQVCNSIKSNFHFSSIEKARKYIQDVRTRKGMVPIYPSEAVKIKKLDWIIEHIDDILEKDLSRISDREIENIVLNSSTIETS